MGVSQQILTDPVRDRLGLDIFWLKNESLEGSANLPDLQAALAQFAEIASDLKR